MRQDRILLLILLLLTAGFRIVDLKADPPSNFDWSGGYFADEGFWSHNARNEILFGTPVTDDWDARIVSPVFALFQKWIFQIFGVGLIQVRIIGILSSLLIVLATFLLFRKEHGAEKAFLVAALICISYPMLVLGRQGILDPFAAALAWCTLALLYVERPAFSFLAGLMLIACCATKYLMIFILVPLSIPFLNASGVKRITFLAGVLLAGIVWFLANYLPNKQLLDSYSHFYASQQSWQLHEVAKNIIFQPFYLYAVKTPAILVFGNLLLLYLIFKPREVRGLERICWVWLLCGILFFALWKYRPLRYYASLFLPLSVLAGLAFYRLQEIGDFVRSRKAILFWIGLTISFAQILYVLLDRWMGWGHIPVQLGIETTDAFLFLFLTVVIGAFLILRAQARWFVAAFVIVFLLSDVRNYLNWVLHPEYDAVNISRDLESKVGNGKVTGQWAPELCLENRVRSLPIWRGFVNSDRTLKELGITHVLQWQYALGGEKFQDWYPEEFRKYHVVARYRIKDSDLVLFERK